MTDYREREFNFDQLSVLPDWLACLLNLLEDKLVSSLTGFPGLMADCSAPVLLDSRWLFSVLIEIGDESSEDTDFSLSLFKLFSPHFILALGFAQNLHSSGIK